MKLSQATGAYHSLPPNGLSLVKTSTDGPGTAQPRTSDRRTSTPVAYVFAGRLRVEGGVRHSLSQWRHHRSSGIERVEKQTKRSLAFVPIVRLHPVPSQLLQADGIMAKHRYPRLKDGLFFQASTVFAKNIGNAGGVSPLRFPMEINTGVTDRFDTRYDRGILGPSRQHRFLLTGLFPVPVGRGRALGSSWSPIDGVAHVEGSS